MFAYVLYVTMHYPCFHGRNPYPYIQNSNLERKMKKLKITECISQRSKIADNISFSLSYDLLWFDHYLIKHLLSLPCICRSEDLSWGSKIHEMLHLIVCGMSQETISASTDRNFRGRRRMQVDWVAVERWWLWAYLNPFILATVSQHKYILHSHSLCNPFYLIPNILTLKPSTGVLFMN